MNEPLAPDSGRAWSPPTSSAGSPLTARRPPRRRLSLHLALLVATFVTLALAGGYFWAGQPADGIGSLFLLGLPYAMWTLIILSAHEMGHYLACRYYGIPASLPFFIPGVPPLGSFGALIRIRGRIPHRRALFDVAAAGPIAGFLVALPVMIYGVSTAEPAIEDATGGFFLGVPVLWYLIEMAWPQPSLQVNAYIGAGWVGMLVTSLNLFPVGQLDGGHAAYAISPRLHRVLARLSLVALLSLMLVKWLVLELPPAYLIWFAILLWMRDRHPPLLDEGGTLGVHRKIIAVTLLLILALSIIPVPVVWVDG